MSRIETTIKQRLTQNEKVFVAYITAGDPDLATTRKLCHTLADNGVDIIELGIPFSDPIADGPTNQRAAQRALEAGASLQKILDLVRDLRQDGFSTPIVLFSYLNPIYRMGFNSFAERAKLAGVDGVLCVDLPSEESHDYRSILQAAGLDTIFLATPTSDVKRLKVIGDASNGFVYYVSRTGVTGAQTEISETLEVELDAVKKTIHQPILIGFGISSPSQAKEIAKWGDGIVIGSAIVSRIEKMQHAAAEDAELQSFLQEVRQALST
ncbi:MAG: tryptophan synthase subunit alpha [Oligoflexus sp.]